MATRQRTSIPQPTATAQPTATPHLPATPVHSTIHQCPAIRNPIVIPTWLLTTICLPCTKSMAFHHSLSPVLQAWLVEYPNLMPNLVTYRFLKVPHLNIRALALPIPLSPRPQQIIHPNHTFHLPAMWIIRKPIRIYSHPTLSHRRMIQKEKL